MKTDIEIAQSSKMIPIREVASELGIRRKEMDLYGDYKCKLKEDLWQRIKSNRDGRLILVTAITPTPAGEGKTTTTVGLGQAMNKIGRNTIIALREPSLGPAFGMKGGATGGGMSQVVPMEDINLHFTGDFQAVSSAHSLISAMLDNHIYQGNQLKIDINRILWKRTADMNDRSLRNIVVGLGGRQNGIPREDGFMITAASEIMAILCLSSDLMDLKERVSRIIVAYNSENKPVTAGDLKAQGAVAMLLKDAIKPNLVQTLENTPALIHGGPFANIAHGCNSLIATRYGLKLADYVITEAGFGSDLGAEKFFNIKCRQGGLVPSAVVIVATVRALKYSGGAKREETSLENYPALEKGFENLEKHLENIHSFGVPAIVAVNSFTSDTEAENRLIREKCAAAGAGCAFSKAWAEGGEGGRELAEMLCGLIEKTSSAEDTSLTGFRLSYENKTSIKDKIKKIVNAIYGGNDVVYAPAAAKAIDSLEELGFGSLPVCIAKTQFSLSDDPLLRGRPRDFAVTVKEVRVSAGAGFIIVLTGEIMVMPGLPKKPAAESIDIDADGVITGLF